MVLCNEDYLSSVRERSLPLFEEAADLIAGRTVSAPSDGSRTAVGRRFRIERRDLADGASPTVSIVVPTFDRHRLLVDAVESVRRQVDVEVVVVNDSETPLPPAVVEALFAGRRGVTLAQHRGNFGLGAARNTGAALARGRWLMMLDDDDVLIEGAVARLLGAAEADGGAVVAFGDHLRQWYEGADPTGTEYRRTGDGLGELHIENPIICGSFMIRRETFAELGGYREDLPVHEDYNLHLRALSLGTPAYVEAPICVYHCRSALPRLNHRRLYWFATSALNHAVFRCLFEKSNDRAVKVAQRENQYAHLARSLAEGCPPAAAEAVVASWWEILRLRGLEDEIDIDRGAIAAVCPSFGQRLSKTSSAC